MFCCVVLKILLQNLVWETLTFICTIYIWTTRLICLKENMYCEFIYYLIPYSWLVISTTVYNLWLLLPLFDKNNKFRLTPKSLYLFSIITHWTNIDSMYTIEISYSRVIFPCLVLQQHFSINYKQLMST